MNAFLHPLYPIQQRLDAIEIDDAKLARLICRLIPNSCPFARTIYCFGHKLFTIPPLCKLNPLYYQLIALRLKALTFLAERNLPTIIY